MCLWRSVIDLKRFFFLLVLFSVSPPVAPVQLFGALPEFLSLSYGMDREMMVRFLCLTDFTPAVQS